jgi:hypothetical protein
MSRIPRARGLETAKEKRTGEVELECQKIGDAYFWFEVDPKKDRTRPSYEKKRSRGFRFQRAIATIRRQHPSFNDQKAVEFFLKHTPQTWRLLTPDERRAAVAAGVRRLTRSRARSRKLLDVS